MIFWKKIITLCQKENGKKTAKIEERNQIKFNNTEVNNNADGLNQFDFHVQAAIDIFWQKKVFCYCQYLSLPEIIVYSSPQQFLTWLKKSEVIQLGAPSPVR